ncbi:MAG: YaeQ family protein [Glaciecola sp.]
MALKPTIYKFKIALSDFNHDHYDSLQLTIAQHPSETIERMMVRVLAYCIHCANGTEKLLAFTKGLSSVEEPDIWLKGLDDQLHMWLDVGEPSFERMKKACRLAKETLVYTFNSKSDVWWKQSQAQLSALPISVFQFDWDSIQLLSTHISRTTDISLTITGQSMYVVINDEPTEINWLQLQ